MTTGEGVASYRKRGKSVQAQVRLFGVIDSASFPSMTMAREWGRKREAEIIAGARGLVATGHSVADMLDRYIKDVCPQNKGGVWEAHRLRLIRREWIAVGKDCDRVTSDDVGKLRDHRLKAVQAPSVRREMVLLSAVFETAKSEWHWCANNPVRGAKKPKDSKPRTRLVSPHEYRAILIAAKYRPGQAPQTKTQWMAAAWCLAIRTGMRAGELMKLEWGHVDLKARVAHLYDTKNGTDRQVPLFPRALRTIRNIPQQHPALATGRVFHQINSGTLDALWRKNRDIAGVVGLTFHDSRATAITMLARRLNILDLARSIGHLDLNSLQTYYRRTASDIAASGIGNSSRPL